MVLPLSEIAPVQHLSEVCIYLFICVFVCSQPSVQFSFLTTVPHIVCVKGLSFFVFMFLCMFVSLFVLILWWGFRSLRLHPHCHVCHRSVFICLFVFGLSGVFSAYNSIRGMPAVRLSGSESSQNSK